MQVETLVEHRVDHRQADRAAEVAHQIERPDAFLSCSGGSVPSDDIVDRHDAQHQRRRGRSAAISSSLKSQSDVIRRHQPGADGEEQEADQHHHARVEHLRQAPAMGAVRNMATPVTNIVSPIIRAL